MESLDDLERIKAEHTLLLEVLAYMRIARRVWPGSPIFQSQVGLALDACADIQTDDDK